MGCLGWPPICFSSKEQPRRGGRRRIIDSRIRTPCHIFADGRTPTTRVCLVRTRSCVGVTLYSVLGEVDLGTEVEFERQLFATLHTAASTIVIDLSELGFLGVAGLEVLDDARAWSQHTHEMYLVTGTECVDHVIAANGMSACFDTFANLDDALREVAKRHGHG
ncbi:STAS domain-containing protein [Nocardia sp. CA-119907]|uniref:STAS domain-containing protein n=1 Tax=Nocardia sp. CA-119907 TaxID=3239973 RepID=UPI003D970552